jgi:UDP-N-acetylmuramoyl-L-alanyl-D-glutamate--2,6-diaminopimelate ligase
MDFDTSCNRRVTALMNHQTLAQLLKNHLPVTARSVTADSRDVNSSTVFVAVRGVSQDGHQFIAQAVQAGAPLIVGEDPIEARSTLLKGVPYVCVRDSRLALAFFAAHFAKFPSHQMTVLGVTGTSGKTTTTYLLESLLKARRRAVRRILLGVK